MNIWLFALIQDLAAAILGFVGKVIVLSTDVFSGKANIGCFAAGFLLSVPAAWIVEKRISNA